MITLEDFIAGLLASANQASTASSVSTLALAEQYLAHPTLKHFPIPQSHIEALEFNTRFAFAEYTAPVTATSADAQTLVDASQDLIAGIPQTQGFESFFAHSPILEKIWALRAHHVGESLMRRLAGATFANKAEVPVAIAEQIGRALVNHLQEYHRHAAAVQTGDAAAPAVAATQPDVGLSEMQQQWLSAEAQKIANAHPLAAATRASPMAGFGMLVAHSETAGLPPETLSTLTVRIGVGYRKWVTVDVDGQPFRKLETY
jgi:hypothetical protein